MSRKILAVTVLAVLGVPAVARAADYPPPGDPGKVAPHPKGKVTLRVCHHGKKRYRTIQRAVDLAGPGDTIRVCDGTYKESVDIEGKRKAGLKLIGNPGNPRKVTLDLRSLKGADKQNGIIANGANGVSYDGFYARNYTANGFFAVNLNGYTMNHLVAGYGGKYGLYAFNTRGGTMENSEAFYNNDSGMYVGETPPQTKPSRTFVQNVRSWGNVLGFSGTNMRYVTIRRSKWWNNGMGIVPNTLSTEKYAPEEDNVITDNDIFWNNFNYFAGAPFKVRAGASDATPYPIGVGVLLFGGRRNVISGNRIYGNYLAGASMLEQVILAGKPGYKEKSILRGNQIRGNVYGLGGRDLNGHDVAYAGGGFDNCVSEGGTLTSPIGNSVWQGCPFTGTNAKDDQAFGEILSFVPDPKNPASAETHWRQPLGHPAKAGYTPLEHCTKTATGCRGQASWEKG